MQIKRNYLNRFSAQPFVIRQGKQVFIDPPEGRVKSLHLNHPLESPWNIIIKRIFDILFSSLVLVLVLSWVLPIIGIMVLIDSGWPVFFVQDRHGKNSRLFKCIKFRTMVSNQECDTRQSSANDERITKFGKIMRKYNLDELPQFINVLAGSMSIVGPRPHMKVHTLEYEREIPYYRERLLVKPGITGLAQARGNHGPTPTLLDMKHRVDYDLFYIKRWNFFLDLKLVLGTFINIFKHSFHK